MARGSYRAIHTVLIDGPDYQALSPSAKLVLLTLKLNLGPTGIDVLYPAVLEAQTGLSGEQVALGLEALALAGWIRQERNVVWIVDGLRYEPSRALSNPNHRKEIGDHLGALPRLAIVDAFRRYYELPVPEIPSRAVPDTPPNGKGDGIGYGIGDGMHDHGEREKGRKGEELSGASGDAPRGGLPPTAPDKAPFTYPPDFEAAWAALPARNGGNSKREAFHAWQARRRGGVDADELTASARRYAQWCAANGKVGTELVMQGRTFFGPSERFRDPVWSGQQVIESPELRELRASDSWFSEGLRPLASGPKVGA